VNWLTNSRYINEKTFREGLKNILILYKKDFIIIVGGVRELLTEKMFGKRMFLNHF